MSKPLGNIARRGNTDSHPDCRAALRPVAASDPPLTPEFTMHRDVCDGRDVLVCTVARTVLFYDARCLEDLRVMLESRGGWVELGSADEQKEVKSGTVEAWGRWSDNPVGDGAG